MTTSAIDEVFSIPQPVRLGTPEMVSTEKDDAISGIIPGLVSKYFAPLQRPSKSHVQDIWRQKAPLSKAMAGRA